MAKTGAYYDVTEYVPPIGQLVVGLEELGWEGMDGGSRYPCVAWLTPGGWRTMDAHVGKARVANVVRWAPLPSLYLDGLAPDVILVRPHA